MAISSPIDARVRDVILRTFKVGDGHSASTLRMGGVPGWDSLGHMRLVVELESEFDVAFAAFHLSELVDEAAIARVVQELQAGKPALRG